METSIEFVVLTHSNDLIDVVGNQERLAPSPNPYLLCATEYVISTQLFRTSSVENHANASGNYSPPRHNFTTTHFHADISYLAKQEIAPHLN